MYVYYCIHILIGNLTSSNNLNYDVLFQAYNCGVPGSSGGTLNNVQMQQFKAQIMAYRFLSRNQPPTLHILAAAQGKKYEPPPPQPPAPRFNAQGIGKFRN